MELASVPAEKELADLLTNNFRTSLRQSYVTIKDFILPERCVELEKQIKEFEMSVTRKYEFAVFLNRNNLYIRNCLANFA